MARKIFSFFLLFILIFSAATFLVLSEGLDRIKSDHLHRQQRVHQAISSELATSYALLEGLISYKSKDYQRLHQKALEWVNTAGIHADLAELKMELSKSAEFPVDIYLIDDSLIVRNTTFAADVGLDFKHPAFTDVRLFLKNAPDSGEILISQPTIELTSRRFKLYSYSTLPNGGYLELGLVDPDLNLFFKTFIETTKRRDDVNIELFFENWGKLLTPIGTPSAEQPSAQQEIDKLQLPLEQEYSYFKQVVDSAQPLRINRLIDGADLTSYYGVLHSITTSIGLPMRLLAKVTFNNDWVAEFEKGLTSLFVALATLAVGFMAALMFLVRHRLMVPIHTLVKAMRKSQPVDSTAFTGGLEELSFLATNYNLLLKRNHEQLAKLEQLSIRDPLTGLHNRRYLEQIYTSEQARAIRSDDTLGFAMIDVDYFKAYNDRYGHPAGDEVLKKLGQLLCKNFRRPGDYVFRVGGEEFAILVTASETEPIVTQFETLCADVMNAAIEHSGSQICNFLTISVGVCRVYPVEQITLSDAFVRADKALYQSKHAGRNQVTEAPDTIHDEPTQSAGQDTAS